MMGDLFGTKADYELGLLYASRRKFLVSAGKNVLEPPVEFKTKKQAHRNYLQHSDEESPPKKCLFDPSHASDYGLKSQSKPNAVKRNNSFFVQMAVLNASPNKKVHPDASSNNANNAVFSGPKKFKKTAQFVVEAVILEQHMEEEMKEEWKEEEVAGVHLWTNRFTGEVTTECPWQPKKALIQRSNSRHRLIATPNKFQRLIPGDEEYGTGSLVYDSSEVNELFNLLDKRK